MQNLSCENEIDLHENVLVGEIHFHKNSFGRRLALTQEDNLQMAYSVDFTFLRKDGHFSNSLQAYQWHFFKSY